MKTALAIILYVSTSLASQQPDSTSNSESARNAIYYEFLGQGLGLSLNYERMLTCDFSVRIGYSDLFSRGFPFGIQYSAGLNHRLEIGAGVTIDIKNHKGVYPTGLIGYRYQEPMGGFVFRVGLTPIIGHPEAPVLIGGISLGWSF